MNLFKFMSTKKIARIIILFTVIILSSFLGYHFLKPYNYSVEIKAKTNASDLYYTAIDIVKTINVNSNDTIIIVEDKIHQNLSYDLITASDSIYRFDWKFYNVNDSSAVAKFTVKNDRYFNQIKLKSLYSSPAIKSKLISLTTKYKDWVRILLDKTEVEIIGIEEIPEIEYCYISTKSLISEKAYKMMQQNNNLIYWMKNNNLNIDGHPALEVTKWNIEQDSIEYNFLFPYKKTSDEILAPSEGIRLKKIKKQKALKALYKGNYITSSMAWFRIIEYAKAHQIKLDYKPFEVFHNNPNQGTDEREWVAEVYIPIIE